MGKGHEQYKRYSINRSYNKFILWYEGTKNFKYGDDEYIPKEYIEECRKYKVCKDAVYAFDSMLDSDEEYFHDERSVDFLRKVAKVEYVSKDAEKYINKDKKEYISSRNGRYADKNVTYAGGCKKEYIGNDAIYKGYHKTEYTADTDRYLLKKQNGTLMNMKQLPAAHKNALVIIHNSYKRMYTIVEYMTDDVAAYLRSIDDMVLYAALQMDKKNSDINKWHQIVDAFLDLEIVNYTPGSMQVIKVYDKVYYYSKVIERLGGYAAIGLKGGDYISDVRIFDYLYFKYHMEYFLSTLRKYHFGYKDVLKKEEDLSDTLEDLCDYYDDYIELYDDYYWLEHDYQGLKEIRSHINLLRPRGLLPDEKTVVCVDYNKDDSLTVREYTTPQNCNIYEVLYMIQNLTEKYEKSFYKENYEAIDKTFFIVIEKSRGEGTYRSSLEGRLLFDTWFGGYIYKDYFDIYDSNITLKKYTDVVWDLYRSKNI